MHDTAEKRPGGAKSRRTVSNRNHLVGVALVAVLGLVGSTQAAAKETHQVKLYPSGVALEYLVKVNGIERCSGAMIQQNQVITAAHCVIDRRNSKPADGMSVEIRGKKYEPDFVIYDEAFVAPYVNSKKNGIIVKYDVAILTFNQKLDGKIVSTDRGMPNGGKLVAIGYQPTWPETGKLLRPKNYDDKSYLKPGVNIFTSKPAACTIPVNSVKVNPEKLTATCGLIPGASGGPLLSISTNGASLVGVLSTVNYDLTVNNWVRGGHIARIIGRADGVIVYSLKGPINGGPVRES